MFTITSSILCQRPGSLDLLRTSSCCNDEDSNRADDPKNWGKRTKQFSNCLRTGRTCVNYVLYGFSNLLRLPICLLVPIAVLFPLLHLWFLLFDPLPAYQIRSHASRDLLMLDLQMSEFSCLFTTISVGSRGTLVIQRLEKNQNELPERVDISVHERPTCNSAVRIERDRESYVTIHM